MLVGGPAVYSVVSEPNIKVVVGGDRKPASTGSQVVAEENTHRNAIKAKSVTIEVACSQGEQAQETDGSLLRLKSECWKMNSDAISVTNTTNGFTASVIETKNNGFTTDYIDLQEGPNRLEISAKNSQGETVSKTMIVNRRLPASQASVQEN